MTKLLLLLGIVIVTLSFTLVGTVVLIRLWRFAEQRHRKQFMEVWHPLLLQSVVEMPAAVAQIAPANWMNFLELWNSFHGTVGGEAKERFNRVARLAGMDRVALKLIRRGNTRQQLMAIIALGNLREQTAWEDLQKLAQGVHPALSMAAAQALVRIDSQAAMLSLAVLFGARRDWSPVKVIEMLEEAGTATIAGPLTTVAVSATSEVAARVLGYLEAIHCPAALPMARQILQRGGLDDRLTIACLRVFGRLGGPQDLDWIRNSLGHHNWCVRLHAVTALGRIGVHDDEHLLIRMLGDDQWWVRYRAGEALSNLPFMTEDKLLDIQGRVRTQAKEILTYFIAALSFKQSTGLVSKLDVGLPASYAS